MATDDTACEQRYNDLRKTIRWGIGLLVCIGLGLATIGGMAWSAGYDAQNELDQHKARQNGSFESIQVQFESIQSQLGTLRVYHSTLRGEIKDQRVVLDELLLRSQPDN